MTGQRAETPDGGGPAGPTSIDTVIVPRMSDIGGFEVRRALPSSRRRMVGPFIFLDEMGPAVLSPGQGLDVRPHPHIGLATVTYLFSGEIVHRDSLGTIQPIRPGDVNWMTAGSGIAHSERTGPETRAAGHTLAGIQSWVALPEALEEAAPAFAHHAIATLPVVDGEGWTARVIAGSALGAQAPVTTASALFYADVTVEAGARVPLETEHEERAAYVASGSVSVSGDVFEAGRLIVFHPGETVTLAAETPCRLMLLGGEPMDGRRYIWWNFVSSRKERIEQAKADWTAGRFGPVPEDSEVMLLPTA